jgi:hypothetical protein
MDSVTPHNSGLWLLSTMLCGDTDERGDVLCVGTGDVRFIKQPVDTNLSCFSCCNCFLAKFSSGAMRNATSKLRLMFREGIVVVVVGRLGEYEGVLGGTGERLLSGDTELLALLLVGLLLLIRAVLDSTRTRCWMLISIVILMGRHSTANRMHILYLTN